LIIADFFKKKDLNYEDAGRVKKWAAVLAINDFATKEGFDNELERNWVQQL
jgi:hypothetical protein